MKQYCRYCENASPQVYDLCYCSIKDALRAKKNCISPNKCQGFEFNEIDVFGFDCNKKYKSMIKTEKDYSYLLNACPNYVSGKLLTPINHIFSS